MASGAVGGLLALSAGDRESAASTLAVEPEIVLPDPVEPAFTVPTPQPLRSLRPPAMWAPVLREVVVREEPSAQARPIARLDETTPEGTENIVLILTRRDGGQGLWVRVRLATLPNDSTGWVPRYALGGSVAVDTHLVVDLDGLEARLLRGGRLVFRAPVGVGQPAWPTPEGHFYVRNKLTTYSSPFYGPVAFGTSARSAVLTDWPAGGFIGIHGTNRPELLPGRVSHGCIRMRNNDILELARLMPVGTPITVH
jgi:hypothetical protein